MPQTLTRWLRQAVTSACSDRRIEDPVLIEKIIEIAQEYRARPVVAAEETWRHPAIQMVRRVTGQIVDAVLITDVIRKVGGHTEDELKACYREWRWRNYRAGALGWLDWLETGIPERKQDPQGQRPNGRPSERTRGLGQEIVYERSQAEFPAHLVTD